MHMVDNLIHLHTAYHRTNEILLLLLNTCMLIEIFCKTILPVNCPELNQQTLLLLTNPDYTTQLVFKQYSPGTFS